MATHKIKDLLIQLKGFNGNQVSTTSFFKYGIIFTLIEIIFGGYVLFYAIGDYLNIGGEPVIPTLQLYIYLMIMFVLGGIGGFFLYKDQIIRRKETDVFIASFEEAFPKINLSENFYKLNKFIELINEDGKVEGMFSNPSTEDIQDKMLELMKKKD